MRRVQFNTNIKYTSEGQKIIAVQCEDNTIHFHDISRGISGHLTEHSSYHGSDAGNAQIFSANLSEFEIIDQVMKYYVRDFYYKSWSKIGNLLTWE